MLSLIHIFSPLALISLGIEVLLAARDGERLRYDWVGMLCLLYTSRCV